MNVQPSRPVARSDDAAATRSGSPPASSPVAHGATSPAAHGATSPAADVSAGVPGRQAVSAAASRTQPGPQPSVPAQASTADQAHSLPTTASRTQPPGPEELLAALDPDQREVAEHLSGPLCVLAGAGTGKTRAITYRIAHGVAVGAYQPTQVLAVTFTARAAGEMRSRLADLGVPGVQARTFHSAALRQLTYFWPTAIGGTRPPIQEHKAGLVGAAARRVGLGTDRATVRDLAAEVEWAKVTMTLPEDYAARAAAAGRTDVAGLDPQTVATVLMSYEDAKTERGVIDFEDVLLLMVGVLADREDVAAQVRGQYKHFVVDEYQDVSPLQQRLLDLWLGRRRQLCVVGDVSQTIYSFTGATPDFLTGFASRYEGARTVRLSRDYRSTPQVVHLANRVLARSRRGGGNLRLPAGAVELQAQRPSGPAVRYETYDDDVAEAAGVVAQVQRVLGEGVALSEIAVLYRTNSQSEVLEQALAEAGIGYLVRGGQRFFAREEVKRAMVMLRAAARTERTLLTGDLGEDVRAVLSREGWAPQAPAVRGAVRDRWESLDALVHLADDLASTRGGDMGVFLDELTRRAEEQNAPTVEGVTLSSLHAAKGLEWDAVLLVGACEGLLPISLAEGEASVEEERRLLYVGVTRAREHLVLSYARARNPGGRPSRRPSRFLDGIWPTAQPATPNRRTRDGAASGGSVRARAKEAAALFEEENDPATVALFEELRAWRAQVAKEASRPAYTVFADATLRSIAVVRPTELAQLSLIRGVGAVKLQEYGPAVLAAVREHRRPA